jgi:GT2 family glycosyltransferase
VSAIVVARGIRQGSSGQSALDLCLRSVVVEPWIDELIIVDQGNAPAISSTFRALQADRRDVKVIRTALPSGAAAANLGAAQARGRWLMFLDPDVVLQRGAVARLAATGGGAQAPCIVGGRLTDTDGRERPVSRVGALNAFSAIAVALDWPSQKTRRRRRRSSAPAQAAHVAAVSSSLMLVPRLDFEALGGFDECFATDGADLDLCRRAMEAGGSILLQPSASGVQVVRGVQPRRKRAQGLARFAAKSAKTPIEKAFAAVAAPALLLLLGLRDFVIGRPPGRR